MANYLVYLILICLPIVQVFSQTNETCKTDPWKGGKFGNPGAKFRLNEKGVDLADKVASLKMTQLIKNLTTSDIKYADLSMTDLKVSDLKGANFNRKLDPPMYIRWGFDNGSLVINGTFSQKAAAGKKNDTDGTVTITSIASMDTTIFQSKDIDGRAYIGSMTCSAKVKNTEITFDPVINITEPTKSYITQQIESSFERLICSTATSQLKDFYNKNLLQSYQTKFDISANGLTLDYGLTDFLKFTENNSAVEGLLKGVVYNRNPPAFPFYPPNIAEKNSTDNPIWEFFMTTYPLNTMFYVAHQEKFLNFSAIPKLMSNASAALLSLSCGESGNCIGSVFPQASNVSESNSYVTLSVITTEPPKVAFNPNQAYMIINKAKVEMKLINDSKTTNLLSATSSCIYANLEPKLSQKTLYFVSKITFLDLNSIDSPMMNDTSNKDDIQKLQNIATKVFEELLNGFLSVGFPIPLANGASLKEPKMELFQDTIYFSDNLTYTAPKDPKD